MNSVIDIGDGSTSVGIVYASGGIKMVKASIERQYEPLSMWFLLGCTRSSYKTVLVVYVQADTGIDKFHNSRYNVTEEFAQNAIKHITKQVLDINEKTRHCLDEDNLNDAFWHDCTAHCSGFEGFEPMKTDKTDDADYSDMPPLVPGST